MMTWLEAVGYSALAVLAVCCTVFALSVIQRAGERRR